MSNGSIEIGRQKIEIFRSCFGGLTHAYGTRDSTGRVHQVKAPVTDAVLLAHLTGRMPYGVYLLCGDHTKAVAVDFDHEDPTGPMAFIAAARHYGLPVYLERSKSKGYHAWMFFEENGVLASKPRLLVRHILKEIGCPTTEVFPKQDRLGTGTQYGNMIFTPLFGRLVTKGRTVFVDPANPTKPLADQWGLLRNIRRVSEQTLDELIEINDLAGGVSIPVVRHETNASERTFGLLPCARRMLAEGVTSNQRVSCFRLAIQLKRAGMPKDLAVATLTTWAAKNRPENGKRVITEYEVVDQVRWAYNGNYRGRGCEEPAIRAYCDENCPLRSGRRK